MAERSVAGRVNAQQTLLVLLLAQPASAREPTFEDRVAAQRAVEEVYWRHRIWPKENPGPKPRLASVMPNRVIRAKVRVTGTNAGIESSLGTNSVGAEHPNTQPVPEA